MLTKSYSIRCTWPITIFHINSFAAGQTAKTMRLEFDMYLNSLWLAQPGAPTANMLMVYAAFGPHLLIMMYSLHYAKQIAPHQLMTTSYTEATDQ